MRSIRSTQPGFTLIEIAVVLVLMALLASVVAVSARGMVGGATGEEVIAQIASLETEARQTAEQTGQEVVFVIDQDHGLLRLTTPKQYAGKQFSSYQLPAGYTIERTWVLRRGQQEFVGDLRLQYSRNTEALTWGVTLIEPGGTERSFMIAGLTGQLTLLETDETARNILARLGRRHPD